MGSTSDFKGCMTHGLWGGSQGNKWVFLPNSFTKKIQIRVRYGLVVDSIEFKTDCSEIERQISLFGGPGGKATDNICIDGTNEYLMSISGTTGGFNGYETGFFEGTNLVRSICFMTNRHLYGPYGTNRGTVFSHDVKDGVVVGFHGRVTKYLTAIGVYEIPKVFASGPSSLNDCKIIPELCFSMSRMAVSRDAGPWGAVAGKPWDDGVYSAIKQVCVYLGELNVIYGLQFQYLKSDGKLVWSRIHGGTDGIESTQLVNLDDNDEVLTGISGFYGPVKGYDGMEAIVSITFHTDKRIYGPFGEERGTAYVFYCSTASSGKIVGFHGRSNGFLSAVGVHMEYI